MSVYCRRWLEIVELPLKDIISINVLGHVKRSRMAVAVAMEIILKLYWPVRPNAKNVSETYFNDKIIANEINIWKKKLIIFIVLRVDICSLPKQTGPCLALFPRYYYDKSCNSCLEFTYGGCKGNGNNFETEEDCLSVCRPCWMNWHHLIQKKSLKIEIFVKFAKENEINYFSKQLISVSFLNELHSLHVIFIVFIIVNIDAHALMT